MNPKKIIQGIEEGMDIYYVRENDEEDRNMQGVLFYNKATRCYDFEYEHRIRNHYGGIH